MSPAAIRPAHYDAILRNNAHFVHWLSPLDKVGLVTLLSHADYARQFLDGEAVAIAYAGQGDYRHKNVDWLSARLDNYLYIDRVIVGASAQGQGLGQSLYNDLYLFAQERGYDAIGCEVNTAPDNPGSHAFHLTQGFCPLGEETYSDGKAVRYYVRKLQE